ncbi:MAG: hypothetical protein ABIK15_19560 [Pseudomonadota bacterium]
MSEKENVLRRFGRRFGWSGGRHGCREFCHQQKVCTCPRCHLSITSENKIPCFRKTCPNCGIPMARRFFPE